MNQSSACCCIGPQDGQPLCPCRMHNVQIVDGRYVETKDLGPVVPKYTQIQDLAFEYKRDGDKH